MSRFWKSFLFLFCSCCFCSAKADDLDLISRAYLSDKKYSKNIEVKAYLVTKDQVAKLFGEENVEITQKTNKELHRQEVFLLVRVKNKGDYMSSGLLNCTIPNRGVPITIDIEMMPGYMTSFHDSVLYIGDGLVPNDSQVPQISYKWKSLYTM
jgi:hypothetical protein